MQRLLHLLARWRDAIAARAGCWHAIEEEPDPSGRSYGLKYCPRCNIARECLDPGGGHYAAIWDDIPVESYWKRKGKRTA